MVVWMQASGGDAAENPVADVAYEDAFAGAGVADACADPAGAPSLVGRRVGEVGATEIGLYVDDAEGGGFGG